MESQNCETGDAPAETMNELFATPASLIVIFSVSGVCILVSVIIILWKPKKK